jgi:hypothetical protein
MIQIYELSPRLEVIFRSFSNAIIEVVESCNVRRTTYGTLGAIFSRGVRLFTLEEIYLQKVEDDWLQHVALRFEPKNPVSIAYVRPKKVIDLIRGRTVHIPG